VHDQIAQTDAEAVIIGATFRSDRPPDETLDERKSPSFL
jgi:hypothetical protein